MALSREDSCCTDFFALPARESAGSGGYVMLAELMGSAPNSPDLSFPKGKRLVRPAEFARVKAEGIAHRGRMLVLGVFAKEDEQLFRAGFVTSKRLGGAVVRNRVRRRLRDVVRTQQGRLRGGFWFVVIARPAAAHASYGALKDEWLRLAERASILAP